MVNMVRIDKFLQVNTAVKNERRAAGTMVVHNLVFRRSDYIRSQFLTLFR